MTGIAIKLVNRRNLTYNRDLTGTAIKLGKKYRDLADMVNYIM